jgi:hypothetical protein
MGPSGAYLSMNQVEVHALFNACTKTHNYYEENFETVPCLIAILCPSKNESPV